MRSDVADPMQIKQGGRHAPNLTDVPETMLWTLNNRAAGARGENPILNDPWTLRIFDQVSYDFDGRFGKPEFSHAVRSRVFDKAVCEFLADAPDGTIVNLGEGVETQRLRIDNGTARWFSVDMPDAIAFREFFIDPDERCRHLGQSALDLSWCDAVDDTRPVFVTAQGLFMYFEESQVHDLISTVAKRLPGVTLMFDHIPRWMARKSLKGMQVSKNYTLPHMPWGVDLNEVETLMSNCAPAACKVTPVDYMEGDNLLEKIILKTVETIPILKNKLPGITHIVFD